jgi:hypothetical protein
LPFRSAPTGTLRLSADVVKTCDEFDARASVPYQPFVRMLSSPVWTRLIAPCQASTLDASFLEVGGRISVGRGSPRAGAAG